MKFKKNDIVKLKREFAHQLIDESIIGVDTIIKSYLNGQFKIIETFHISGKRAYNVQSCIDEDHFTWFHETCLEPNNKMELKKKLFKI